MPLGRLAVITDIKTLSKIDISYHVGYNHICIILWSYGVVPKSNYPSTALIIAKVAHPAHSPER
jgi:hypothetical protein